MLIIRSSSKRDNQVAIIAPGRSGKEQNSGPGLGSERENPPAPLLASRTQPRPAGPRGVESLSLRPLAALVILATALLLLVTPVLATVQPVLPLPWFVPAVTGLTCLAFGALGFLGYLRYATSRLLYPLIFA